MTKKKNADNSGETSTLQILEEQEYRTQVKEILARYNPLSNADILNKWDSLKEELAYFSQLYSKKRERRPRKQLETMEQKSKINNSSTTSSQPSISNSIQEYLQEVNQRKLLQARIKADVAKELPSPVLTNLIKRNITANTIFQLQTNYKTTRDHKEISEIMGNFYETLYSKKETKQNSILTDQILTLSSSVKEQLSLPPN
jgi:hypothetical protein